MTALDVPPPAPPVPPAVPPSGGPPPAPPRPKPSPGGSGQYRQRDRRQQQIQLVLFTVGGVLMPFGLLAICLAWYGVAHSHYIYDQNTYLISGGVLGLALSFVGGFLYFGGWLSRQVADQRQASAQLTDAILALADVMNSRRASDSLGYLGASTTVPADLLAGVTLVYAGQGTTVHRRDCPLIASREDLRAYVPGAGPASPCRVCKPEF